MSNSPDGGKYGTPTNGSGTIVVAPTLVTNIPKLLKGNHAPDGSKYMVLTDGVGNLT